MIAEATPVIDRLIPQRIKTNFVRRPSLESQSNRTTGTSNQARPGKSEGHGFLGHLIEINGSIDDPKEKANIIQNCEWICRNAERVLDHADANMDAGRVLWSGAKQENKIEVSKMLHFLSGATDKEFYSNNVLLYQLANAIKLSVQKGTKVSFYFDIDGCISGKARRPYATREAQPLEQIHELYTIIKLLSGLGIKVTTNTNRAPLTTAILVTPKALKPFTNTNNPHNSPMVEVTGLDPQIACKMSKSLGVGALSTGFRDLPGENTFIHPKLRLMYDIFNEFGEDFWDDFVKDAAVEYECTTVEPKGLNSLLMLQDSCSAPSYKSFLKIAAIKDHYVTREKNKSNQQIKKEYEDYGNELLKHIEDREPMVELLTEIEELLKEKEKNIINGNTNKLDEKREELDSIVLKSRFSEKPSLSWGEDLESVKKDLENIKNTIASYVSLPGENESDKEYINYTDSFGKKHEVLNPYNLLLHNPQMFDRKIRRAAHTNVCFHYDNPRNVKREELVDRQASRLAAAENKTGKSGKKIRHLIQEANLRMISNPRLSKAEKADFNKFIADGKSILGINSGNSKVDVEHAKGYLNWRLEKFIVLRNSREEIEKLEVDGIKIFNCDNKGVAFNKEFLDQFNAKSLEDYMGELRTSFFKAGGLATELIHYADDVYTKDFIDNVDAHGSSKLEEARICPDYLFNVNYKRKYNGKDEKQNDLLSVAVIEDKRDRNQDYVEVLPNLVKADIVPGCSSTYDNNEISFTFGDSTSDISAHIQALLSFTFIDGEIHGGVASQIYNLILEEDYKNASISKLLQLTKDAKENRFDKFSEFCSKTGLFGLEKVEDAFGNLIGYKKTTGIKGQAIRGIDEQDVSIVEENTYVNDGEVFSTEQIQKDFIEVFARHRIVTNEAPDANIRRLFEGLCHVYGLNVAEQEFKQSELDKALAYSKKSESDLTDEEKKLVEKYKPVIAELERGRYMPYDTPDSRKYVEYIDDSTGEKYYRFKDTKLLTTKDGSKVYQGNEKDLRKRAIIDEVIDGEYGVLVYEDSFNVRGRRLEVFDDLDFLNEKCLYEDSALPPPSPPSGFFSNKLLIKLLGGGEKGIDNLKYLISKMPKMFSGILEWSGGLMVLGGVTRIVSNLFGSSEESLLYRGGYWVSNIARATSACGGALRGLVHPQKYYDITMGEVVNAFSAIFLPNGLKHFGFAWSNTAIFTGRGRQSIQRQLSTNLKPAKNGVIVNDPEEKDKDPKALQTELTKFSSEEIVLRISNAAAKAGVPQILGDWVGTVASAVLTPIRHIKDVIKDPSLLTVKQWISEKSGTPFRNFKSVGHVLTSVGVLSGLFATVGGLFGRMEKLGEVTESGFNSIGRWALSAATAIPALGIIANGFEIAANAEGIPKTTRGLDGKTIVYDPKRAGLSQVAAGLIYAVVPWFDLSKPLASSAFDIGTGAFFGFPKLKIGVAAEDEYTALKEAENSLFKGPYFERVEEKILPATRADAAAGRRVA